MTPCGVLDRAFPRVETLFFLCRDDGAMAEEYEFCNIFATFVNSKTFFVWQLSNPFGAKTP